MTNEAAVPDYFNDPIERRVVRLLAYMKEDRSDKPSIATGFIMEHNDVRYLISNYHVFTGISPTQRYSGGHPRIPLVIEIWHFGVPVADVFIKTDYIVHSQMRELKCDVAAYPLSNAQPPTKGKAIESGRIFENRASGIQIIDPMDFPSALEDNVEMHRFVNNAFMPISRDVTVFGFPGGIGFNHSPIGINTKMASNFYHTLPYFFVSGTTYKGCSGGPVVARSIGGYQALKLIRSEKFLRSWASSYRVSIEATTTPIVDQLIGIYSGRMKNDAEMCMDEDGAGFVGQVWHWRLIQEILASGTTDVDAY